MCARTEIYFVRHASPNYDNHEDSERELTAKGLEDSKLVTSFLNDKKIDVVLSSPYRRAVDTVKNFADTKNLKINLCSDFRERKVGNMWIENFEMFSKRQWEGFDYKLPEGESLKEVQKRNIDALAEILKKCEGKRIVIGSHGTALCTVIHYFVPIFGYEDFQKIKNLMPWIVTFCFQQNLCTEIRSTDLFTQTTTNLIPQFQLSNRRF